MDISIWQILIILSLILITIGVFGPVAKKAGYSRWWSLLLLVPVANLVVVWGFAFVKWPAEKNT